MAIQESVQKFTRAFQESGLREAPHFHLVLGSGFGSALEKTLGSAQAEWELLGELSFDKLPALRAATTPDHAGKYQFLRNREKGFGVIAQVGRLHGYEGIPAREIVNPVMIPRLAGVKRFFLTNAAGGLDRSYRSGDVMLIRDHVNFTGQNPLVGINPTGLDGADLGPRFPDLKELYESVSDGALRSSLEQTGLRVHEGIYLGLLGPSFETPAEIRLFAHWGLQAVGMSTVWESIALKHSGARVWGLSLISNLGCGLIEGETLDHLKIIETCRGSAEQIARGVMGWIGRTTP